MAPLEGAIKARHHAANDASPQAIGAPLAIACFLLAFARRGEAQGGLPWQYTVDQLSKGARELA